jgi:hypothetical protein
VVSFTHRQICPGGKPSVPTDWDDIWPLKKWRELKSYFPTATKNKVQRLAMSWTADESWFDPWQEPQSSVFPKVFRSVLRLTHPPTQRTRRFALGKKRHRRESGHRVSIYVKVKNEGSYSSTTTYTLMSCMRANLI